MKYLKIAMLILFSIFIVACEFSKSLESIEIIGDQFIDIDEVKLLDVIVKPNNSKYEVEWSSSNEKVLLVEEDGYMIGRSVGQAEITATIKGTDITHTITVSVFEAVLESISILGSKELYVDSTISLSIKSIPSHAKKDVIWTSSNEEIAKVDQNGKVTGISSGNVVISAASIYDEEINASYQLSVKINDSTDFELVGPSSVDVGEEVLLSAILNEIDISLQFNWTSSNEEVALVSSAGVLKALSQGTVTITATNRSNSAVVKSINIEIKIAEYKYVKTKILSIDRGRNYIELLNVSQTKLTKDTQYIHKIGDKIKSASLNDLYIGSENIYVQVKNGSDEVRKILIDEETGFSNIRVAIRKNINDIADDNTLYHDTVDFQVYSDTTIKTFDNEKSVRVNLNSILKVSTSNSKIIIKNNDNNVIFESNKRIIIIPDNQDDNIFISSISRGSNRKYSGIMEVTLFQNKLLVVNDVNLEKYLYKVVPSEMPASYHMEALKAQAVAARTYAYGDILNKTYEKYGFTVDDSTKSQVYNNGNEHANTTNATNATKGLIMMNNGQLVNAFYYATSSGITASAHEVWITEPTLPPVTPYLIGQNHAKELDGSKIEFDYQDETNMLSFFKKINIITNDSTIAHHRWRVSFSKAQLTQTISKNMTLRYAQTPNLILTKNASGQFVSLPITNDIGEVTNIYVGQRGTSGVVISLIIETTKNTYKIINQYNIRFTIRPMDANVSNETASAGTSYTKSGSNSILFSGFFAIEEKNGNFTFYGGGNGHGVGMSQNGANTLGKNGSSFNKILNSYYSNIDLTNISYNYKPLDDFKKYF